MLHRAIEHHTKLLAASHHVLDADGNIFSDDHRAAARKEVALHTAILKDLQASQALLSGDIGDVSITLLSTLRDANHAEAKALDFRSEGTEKGSFSRGEMVAASQKAGMLAKVLDLVIPTLAQIAGQPRIKHRKRGTYYAVLGACVIQSERPLRDTDVVFVYRDRDTGALFARPPEEMTDGRFEWPQGATLDVQGNPVA